MFEVVESSESGNTCWKEMLSCCRLCLCLLELHLIIMDSHTSNLQTCKSIVHTHINTCTIRLIYQIKCVDLPVILLCVTGAAGVEAGDGNTGRVQLKTSAVFMSGKTFFRSETQINVFIFKWKLTICDNDL